MKKIFNGYELPGCVQTIKNAASKMEPDSREQLHQSILKKAARNKVFDKEKKRGAALFWAIANPGRFAPNNPETRH